MKHYILLALLLTANFAFGQTIDDVVRYGRTENIGTARAAAMGGAMGALGGDIGSLGVNPAGIGVFRRSEFSLSPTVNIASTNSNGLKTNKTSFQLGSIGAVISVYEPKSDWRGFNFGFNYTSVNNFNRESNYAVNESTNSILDAWAQEANDGSDADRLDMAWTTKLIEYDYNDSMYYAPLNQGDNVNQRRYIKESGHQGEYNISFGTNYKDKLYLGMNIGIESFDYSYSSIYDELAPISENGLDQFFWGQNSRISGSGANFSVGAIYRPIPEFRLGASIKTPTYFNISDNYDENLESFFFGKNESEYDYVIYSTYDYKMRTQWKATVSVATVLMQRLIVSVDYEFNGYKAAEFNTANYGFNYFDQSGGLNDVIDAELKNTSNLRLGAEYRLNSIFSLRAGYMFKDSPYRYAKDIVHNTYSGGLGLNFGSMYVDASYSYKMLKDKSVFYSYLPQNATLDVIESAILNNKYIDHEAKLTVGFRF